MPDSTAVLANVNNAAYKIEKALYQLHTAIASKSFKDILDKLPDVINTFVLKPLGNILDQVRQVVSQFLDKETMDKVRGVLEAGLSVVSSTVDLLPEAAQRLAETAHRFIAVVVDFISAGIEHIKAIVDLLGKVGAALIGNDATLDPTTIAALKVAGALPA